MMMIFLKRAQVFWGPVELHIFLSYEFHIRQFKLKLHKIVWCLVENFTQQIEKLCLAKNVFLFCIIIIIYHMVKRVLKIIR